MSVNVQIKTSLIKTMFKRRFNQANTQPKSLTSTLTWRHLLLLLFALPFAAQAQITGTAFRDFNGNGTQGTAAPNLEIGASGIMVTAYFANGSSVTTTTNAMGVYSFTAADVPSGTAVRIEFEIAPACGNGATNPGPSGGTSVQFVSGGATNVNFGINSPAEYTGSAPVPPSIIVPVSVYGGVGITSYGAGGNNLLTPSLQMVGFNSGTAPGTPNAGPGSTVATMAEIGNVWGTAYQRQSKLLFSSSVVKRHAGLKGTAGDIYVTNLNGTPSSSLFVNVNTIGINVGDVAAERVGMNDADWYCDAAAGALVGKRGIGDIDLTDDGRFMFLTNLQDRTLYRIAITNPATSAPTAGNVTAYPNAPWLTNPAYQCTNGVARPWGIAIHNGKVYVGVVCTGENGGSPNDLNARVFELNPSTNIWTPTPIVDIPLNYLKGNTLAGIPRVPAGARNANLDWNPWIGMVTAANMVTVNGNPWVSYPQPILSNISFDTDGSILVGLMDRTGHMVGAATLIGSTNTPVSGLSAGVNCTGGADQGYVGPYPAGVIGGDLLRVGLNPATCVLSVENNGTSYSNGVAVTSAGAGNAQGIGGGEFYFQDGLPVGNYGNHQESFTGSMAVMPGTGQLVTGAMDPHAIISGGVSWFDNTTGAAVTGSTVYNGATDGYYTYQKANGIGDIEFVSPAAPVEIGNRVWLDTDKDGVQDPNETPIAGVVINLYADVNQDGIADNTTIIGTATTAADGTWYFNNTNVADGDPTTAGAQIGLTPGMGYVVQIASSQFSTIGAGPLLDLTPSVANTGGAGQADVRDSDGTLVGGLSQIAVIIGSTGQNNHTLDFGFAPALLPVDYLSIAVYAKSEQVHLNWATVTEVQNEKFDIERVRNTNATPELIGSVKGNGNSNQVQTYALIDTKPYAGTSYYRLVQVDFDGKRSTSKWYSVVNRKFGFEIRAYPNPATDQVSLELQSNAGNQVSVSICNLTGQVMQTQNINLTTDGTSVHELNIKSLPQGVYVIQATSKNQTKVLKLVVQK